MIGGLGVTEKRHALEVARHAADEAKSVLLSYLGGELIIDNKGDVDLVSQADRAAEAAIIKTLNGAFPHDAILGEEGGQTRGDSGRRWVIDPLDGTTNFVHRLPHFAVSIALEAEGQLEVGLILDPCRDERFEATRGGGATLNGKAISVSACQTLGQALLATGLPYDRRTNIDDYLPYVRALAVAGQGIRRAGAAALDLAWVAAGRLDGYWEFKLKPWDVAAGLLLVHEAGGFTAARRGQPHTWGDDLIVACGHGLKATLGRALFDVDPTVGWPSSSP